MLQSDIPALILAPMDGVTDAPMRALQGEIGGFTFAVSEFVRVSQEAPPARVFRKRVPELKNGGRTMTGLPVQVQILGGDAPLMAVTALNACLAGTLAIDINFGCPSPTVNRHDGGAALLRYPLRIREIVRAVRDAVPPDIPVSAKLRLGWTSMDDIFENAAMAAEGGADWLTIHARTSAQGYAPPANWDAIARVKAQLGLPIVANGDIWDMEQFRRCRDITGCAHFMLGRGALANPTLSRQIAQELGIASRDEQMAIPLETEWPHLLRRLIHYMERFEMRGGRLALFRLKQWLRLAGAHGAFTQFEAVKEATTVEDLLAILEGEALRELVISNDTCVASELPAILEGEPLRENAAGAG